MTNIIIIIAVSAIFAVSLRFSAGQECVTGDACHNVTHNVTVGNTTYCCSDVTLRPTTKNNSCACLSANARMKNWADETMGEGRMCSFGNEGCPHGFTTVKLQNDQSQVCCSNGAFSFMALLDVGSSYYVGCRCRHNPAPVLPLSAHAVPLSAEYNSSGELCLYDALCDDNPSLKCEDDNAVYCCYSSRGIHTKDLNASTTACTCSNEFQGTRCSPVLKPLPVTEKRCLTNDACSAVDEAVTSTGGNVTYCCPDLRTAPHVQVIEGATTRSWICSCSAPTEIIG
ncbi:uncharacterized protein LOC112562940 [Pomacea canaliculata]|uniref:uncharacterized protein LOC112562940 n=1 Tax=Pomacea canaliculata TaxID=400727 RepID=UPI000D73FB19|nr:uncharacterized protein LOC112562940 [Pomacea canaliculata]XP_025092348.1 uncharacterized protein LOC112562940 [Pomacea canaliculata]